MSIRVPACKKRSLLMAAAAFLLAVSMLVVVSIQPATAQSRVIQKWVATVQDPAQAQNVTLVNDMAPNSSGGATVAGDLCISADSSGNCTNLEFAIETYNASGQKLWGSFIGSAGNKAEATRAVDDSSGEIYALGWEQNSNGTQSMMLVKYSPSGTRGWIRYYGYYQNSSVQIMSPDAIAVDAQNNVYIVGDYSLGGEPPRVSVTQKFSSSGQLLWSSSIDYSDGLNPQALAMSMVVDPSANVYIAFNDSQNGGNLLKLDPNGNFLWQRATENPDSKQSLALDSSGNIYVEGSVPYNPNYTGEAAFAAKYDPSGEQLWINRATACPNGTMLGWGATIAVDSLGGVFLSSQNCSAEPMVTKYDSSGNFLWQKSYSGASNSISEASYTNSAGDFYVLSQAASITSGSNNLDYLTVKYDGAGNLLWAIRYSGPNKTSSSLPISMAASGGDLFVTGSTGGPTNSPTEWATIDYVQDAADATPTSLTFSSQVIDTTSAAQSVTLKNTATQDLDIRGIDVSGPFSETNNCSSVIVGGGSCTIEVRFTPTSTGTQTGSLSISDQWAGSPDVVTLSGSAVQ
jgi:hypothetical protein